MALMRWRALLLALSVALAALSLSGSVQTPPRDQPEQSQPQPQTSAAPPSYCPPSPAGQPSGAAPSGQAPAEEVAPKPGEICLICNEPIGEGDTVYIVNGQRVPVHRGACDAKLRAELPRVVARLQPVSGFLGDRPGESAVSRVWFFAGLYVLLALIFAALCGHRALHKGRRPVLWFGLGLVFPVLGYLVLAMLPKRAIEAPGGVPGGLHKVAATYRPQSCAKCGRENHPSATRCLGCGAPLVPDVVSDVARVAVHRSG